MNGLMNTTNLEEKLETHLSRACQAEAEGNHAEAERHFRYALFCEGYLRPDVRSAREYADHAGHPGARLEGEYAITGDDNETQTTN